MGDRAYTTVCAWSWPGEDNLPKAARDALVDHGLAGIENEAVPEHLLVDATVAVLDGDGRSGVLLSIIDAEANCGTEHYRQLITALHEAGLSVYATNAAGDNYDACWEHLPAGTEPREGLVLETAGPAITAGELLEECNRQDMTVKELAVVDDAALGAAAKRLLTRPDIPQAVLDLA